MEQDPYQKEKVWCFDHTQDTYLYSNSWLACLSVIDCCKLFSEFSYSKQANFMTLVLSIH